MVAVAILGVLLSIAIPTYDKYIFKGKFEEAKIHIQAISLAQERRKSETNHYYLEANLTNEQFILENLNVNLTQSRNFLYSIDAIANLDEYIVRATLRDTNWGQCSSPATISETFCKQEGTLNPEGWVSKYDTKEGHYYISFDSRKNTLDTSSMFEDGQ